MGSVCDLAADVTIAVRMQAALLLYSAKQVAESMGDAEMVLKFEAPLTALQNDACIHVSACAKEVRYGISPLSVVLNRRCSRNLASAFWAEACLLRCSRHLHGAQRRDLLPQQHTGGTWLCEGLSDWLTMQGACTEAARPVEGLDRAAARSKDLQLEAEEMDAFFIADELDRQACISVLMWMRRIVHGLFVALGSTEVGKAVAGCCLPTPLWQRC